MALDVDTLAADYLVRNLVDARLTRVVTVPNPGVGVDWDVAVPGGVFWDVSSVFAILSTSAVVANRIPALEMTDGSTLLARMATDISATASAAWRYTFVKGQTTRLQGVNNFGLYYPLPPILLSGGWHIRVTTAAIDVGDQWNSIALVVRELAADRISEVIRKSQQDVIGLLGEPSSLDFQL